MIADENPPGFRADLRPKVRKAVERGRDLNDSGIDIKHRALRAAFRRGRASHDIFVLSPRQIARAEADKWAEKNPFGLPRRRQPIKVPNVSCLGAITWIATGRTWGRAQMINACFHLPKNARLKLAMNQAAKLLIEQWQLGNIR